MGLMDTEKFVDKLISYRIISDSCLGVGVLFFVAALFGGKVPTLFFVLSSACFGFGFGLNFVLANLKKTFPTLEWIIENKKVICSKKGEKQP